MSELRFDGKVAIVTGAGGGLGRIYALSLASRGCSIVVNDLGTSVGGEGKDASPAAKVVQEIKTKYNGKAVPNFDSVENGEKIVKTAIDNFGRIDIVINNAGILRDKSFQKMDDKDWDLVYRVHLWGTYKLTRAAWNYMREQGFGRIIFVSSAAGLYGNFGQANYSAMKMAVIGLCRSLAIEGGKRNVFSNVIAPLAGSRMTETVMPPEVLNALKPEYVAPLVTYLCHESTQENGSVFEVGAGWIAKLRWQRTKGAFFPITRPLEPEYIRDAWGKITDFTGEVNYPTAGADSMGLIMENIENSTKRQTGHKSASSGKKGNENVDIDTVLNFKFPSFKYVYDEKQVILYALGIGAAVNPVDPKELKFTYENFDGFKPLPTFAVTFFMAGITGVLSGGIPGLNFNPMMLLHGEQYLEIKKPLATAGNIINYPRVKGLYDKGKGALLVIEVVSKDEKGDIVAINEMSSYIRGLGGFGGERGPAYPAPPIPNRAPDAIHTEKTLENQALLYRLGSGDLNPLHADPSMAAIGGFEKPILHGLCNLGFAVRAVLKHFCNNDSTKVKSVRVRFSKHVFPGDTIVTEMWNENGTILFRSKVVERDAEVLSGGVVELNGPAGASAPAASSASSGSNFGSGAIGKVFAEIDQAIKKDPSLVKQVDGVYLFELDGSDGGKFTVDLKNGTGSVSVGSTTKPDCTFIMSAIDFVDLVNGKLKAQQAFMKGKLKIRGNMRFAQKFETLLKARAKL